MTVATAPKASVKPEPIDTPPGIVLAGCIAIGAYYLVTPSWLLPLLALSMIASLFVKARMDDGAIFGAPRSVAGAFPSRLARVVQILLVIVAMMGRSGAQSAVFGDLGYLDWILMGIASELAFECWLYSSGPGRGKAQLVLACLVFLGGCATSAPGPMYILAPLFFLFLAIGIRQYTIRREEWRPGDRIAKIAAAILVALLFGSGSQYFFEQNKDVLTSMGIARHDNPDDGANGIDKSPRLESSPGGGGSHARILRIDGQIDDPHLHGMAFDTYELSGEWKPDAQNRRYHDASDSALAPTSGQSALATVTRFAGDDGMVAAPLSCAGVILPQDAKPSIDNEGAEIKADGVPLVYRIVASGNDRHQGSLATPPSDDERRRLLAVPSLTAKKLGALTAKIAPAAFSDERKIAAVTSYLMRNNLYSTTVSASSSDPVSVFVLEHESGHCQFFASAATIMLRLDGIPTRLVIGYYAHESCGKDSLVVRGQDAHAWCEAWVKGIGWETVDATPADGRPDRTADTAFWWSLLDRWQDAALWLKSHAGIDPFAAQTLSVAALLLIVLVIGARVLIARKRPVKKAKPPEPEDRYLAELSGRYRAVLRRDGFACPDDLTWSEHLATISSDASLDFECASEFVVGYNRMRFGGESGAPASRQLDELLIRLEKEIR